jgi:ABC-type branched-subunit amino acid transport system substrate-binding protein
MPAAGHAANQQLRVAIVIPRSGPFTIHNRLIANGATIATNEINAQGAGSGHAPVHLKLKVVTVGPTAGPKGIVRGLVRASTRALVLPCNIELEESLARAASKAGLLTLSPCNPDSTFGKGLSHYWQTGATGAAEVGQLVYYAQYAYNPSKTAFLLGTKGSWYSRQMIPQLRASAKRNKLKVVGEASVPAGSHGVAGLASRISKANPDIVFATIPSPGIESIINGLRQRQVKSAFFVTDGMDASINFLRYRDGPDSSSLEQVVFATFGFPRPAGATFLRDYAETFGKKPLGNFPGLGFETVQVLEAAARRAGALTPTGLNASFAKGFTVKGTALEDISYRGHRHRQPATSLGIAEVIRDAYVALFSSLSGHPTG